MGSTPEFRKAFVARLKQACDESKLIPKPGHGRQQMIADRLQLGAEAVSKWFRGDSMPRPDKMALLADLLETDQSLSRLSPSEFRPRWNIFDHPASP